MMEVRVELTPGMQEAVAQAGMDPEEWVKGAMFLRALYQKDPDAAKDIMEGLEDMEAGRFATDDEVEAVFAKYTGENNG